MTSSNVNMFRVTCPLCGEVTGHQWITLTKASATVDRLNEKYITTPTLCVYFIQAEIHDDNMK